MREPPDDCLIARVREGDLEAYSLLVKRHQQLVLA
jgi:hypothetical protein